MSSVSTRVAAPVLEVFASIQGEGAYVGEPQVLLRLRGCPLRCAWCDTPHSWTLADSDTARIITGSGPERRDGWATPFQAACWVAESEPGEPRTVSVTGGEPLLWPAFLLGLPAVLGGRRIHLETAGAHPATLARVRDAVDHVSLDLKLPADLAAPQELTGGDDDGELPAPTGERAPGSDDDWQHARRACLELVAGRDAAAKVVVSAGRAVRDYAPLLEDLARLAPDVPLFLQPATPVADVRPPSVESLTELAEDARDLGLRVRIVPQVHRALRMR